jgi:hypothetical protein
MAIQSINTLKSWFKRGLKPLQQQFSDWLDSYWHKEETIPIAFIEGLQELLNKLPSTDAIGSLVELFAPEEFTTTSNFAYTLKTKRRLQSIIIIPSVLSTIRVGSANGSEDLMLESTIPPNEAFIIDCALYAVSDIPVYINGITESTKILIYKR